MVVLVDSEELRALISDAVADAIAKVQPKPESEWLDDDAAAALLGYERSYLPQAIKRYRIPHHRVGRAYRFRRSELDRWLLDHGTP